MPDQSDEDGHAVGEVQADGRDGGGGCEGDGGAEGGKSENEGQGCGEPDGAGRGPEAGVDVVKERGDAMVSACECCGKWRVGMESGM